MGRLNIVKGMKAEVKVSEAFLKKYVKGDLATYLRPPCVVLVHEVKVDQLNGQVNISFKLCRDDIFGAEVREETFRRLFKIFKMPQ